jgi:hypothetical protein
MNRLRRLTEQRRVPAGDSWFGEPALRVTSGDGSRLLVVPGRGAKIASLVDPAGVERLAQPGRPLPPPARPGDAFVESDMCGWDECAPAVLPERVVVDGRDVVVPDHGELWTADWSVTYAGGAVVADTVGRSQDYRFRRTVEPADRGFRLRYRVRAGSRPVAMCWVAHPQFTAPPGSVVQVPGTRVAVDVLDPGRPRRAWPTAGVAVDAVPPGGCAKVYTAPEHAVGEARLTTPGRGALVLAWDAAAAPFCGVWVDRGAYSREDVVAIEPASGFADGLADALGSGRVMTVAAEQEVSWWLEVQVEAR